MLKHIVNPKTEEWYHLDDKHRVWSCGCKNGVSLCLSICEHLEAKGELRDIQRQIALKRKELGLLWGQKYE